MRTRLLPRIISVLVILFFAQTAFAICDGEANIVAETTNDPEAPDWTYTLTIMWTDVFNIHH